MSLQELKALRKADGGSFTDDFHRCIYVIRRRQLIDLIEHCRRERHDFVTDILIRYKNLKNIWL